MAGVVPPPPSSQQQQPQMSLPSDSAKVNSYRVLMVMERLGMHVRGGYNSDPNEFFNLCLSLARGIDFAVANSEIPSMIRELPSLLKQVCQRNTDVFLHAAIMVLMISVKSACESGWFLANDADDLLKLTTEILRCYCSMDKFLAEPSNVLPLITKVMTRFYPQMKMGIVLTTLEVKPGHETLVTDFNIPKKMKHAVEEKIYLLVTQIDKTETSSCIISPPLVNFLVNGKGVPRRTNVFVESGPQLPTDVTSLLKYGANLLQAIGQFDGNYVIAIAFMSVTSSLDAPILQDHNGPLVVAQDSDSEIIEGPSRISLNCPISLSRIATPVKGHLCKHHQCFDYDNFIKMNLRRPSWRCPHCNQSVSYTDIRIDQFMVKVLGEVGENVADVVISADGSWKPVLQNNEFMESLGCQKDGSKQCERAPDDLVDLTEEGMDSTEVINNWEPEDRKPLQDVFQGCSVLSSMDVPLQMNSASEIAQNVTPPMGENFWLGVLRSCSSFETACTNSGSNILMASGLSDSTASLMPPSMATDPITVLHGQQTVGSCVVTQPNTSLNQNQLTTPTPTQLQPSRFGYSVVSSDISRPGPARFENITRIPTAVQALAAPNAPTLHQQPRTNLNSLLPSHSLPAASRTSVSVAPHSDGFSARTNNTESLSPFLQSPINQFPASDMVSASVQPHIASQNWGQQNNFHIPRQSQQQIVGLPAISQVPCAYRGNSGVQSLHQSPHQQQIVGLPAISQVPGAYRNNSGVQSMHQSPHQQQIVGLPAISQVQGAYRGSSGVQSMHQSPHHSPHQQQARNVAVSQSPIPSNLEQSSSQFSLPHVQRGLQNVGGQTAGSITNTRTNSRSFVSATNTARVQPVTRALPVVPVQLQPSGLVSSLPLTAEVHRASIGQHSGNTGAMVQRVSSTDQLLGIPSEQNWRPTERMRGSLTGRASFNSLSQYIIHPSQPTQISRPPSHLISQSVQVPPQGIPGSAHGSQPGVFQGTPNPVPRSGNHGTTR